MLYDFVKKKIMKYVIGELALVAVIANKSLNMICLLRHPFISAGLEPVLSHTVKSCIADKFSRILE